MSARNTVRAQFDPFGWVLDFVDCPNVLDNLEHLLASWRVRRFDPAVAAHLAPIAEIRREGERHHWTPRQRDRPRFWPVDADKPAWDAVCDTIDAMIDWFLQDNPRYLCLHGAGVEVGDGLVCFPSIGRAGKSTLCMELVARGLRLFADDVLPLEQSPAAGRTTAMGLGLPPRVRLPLAETTSGRARAFMGERAAMEDWKWRYFTLSPRELAPYGERASLKAFVLLERGDGVATSLEPIAQEAMLAEVVKQNFSQVQPAIEILDRLIAATGAADAFRLRYDHAEQGADALIRQFADAPSSQATEREGGP